MKKSLMILAVALFTGLVFAQDGAAILNRFVDLTGSEKFKSERNGQSSYLEIDVTAGPVVMPIKVTTKYPSSARIEMAVQGQNLILIKRDTLAWLKAGGQIQKLTLAQVSQIVPMTDISDAVIDDIKNYTKLTLAGVQGKGKSACNVVSYVNEKLKSTGKMYFNVESGLLERAEEVGEVDGKKTTTKTVFKNYTKYADGVLYLPSKIEASTPQGNVTLEIKSFELDYPTAAWMFAEPK